MSLLNWITFTLVSISIVFVRAVEFDAVELGDWCGTAATEDWLAADYARAPHPSAQRHMTGPSSITVDTYFHIVTNSTRVQDGWLTVSSSRLPVNLGKTTQRMSLSN